LRDFERNRYPVQSIETGHRLPAGEGALDKRPFGTQQDIYGNNFEWINHSIVPCPVEGYDFRVTVGGADCRKPYALSLFNISAMSFGALSANAIRALNRGAKLGGFAGSAAIIASSAAT